MDIEINLSVITENTQHRDLTSISDDIIDIIDDVSKVSRILIKQFIIRPNDRGIECVFNLMLSNNMINSLSDEKISHLLDNVCATYGLKPIVFTWYRC